MSVKIIISKVEKLIYNTVKSWAALYGFSA